MTWMLKMQLLICWSAGQWRSERLCVLCRLLAALQSQQLCLIRTMPPRNEPPSNACAGPGTCTGRHAGADSARDAETWPDVVCKPKPGLLKAFWMARGSCKDVNLTYDKNSCISWSCDWLKPTAGWVFIDTVKFLQVFEMMTCNDEMIVEDVHSFSLALGDHGKTSS